MIIQPGLHLIILLKVGGLIRNNGPDGIINAIEQEFCLEGCIKVFVIISRVV